MCLFTELTSLKSVSFASPSQNQFLLVEVVVVPVVAGPDLNVNWLAKLEGEAGMVQGLQGSGACHQEFCVTLKVGPVQDSEHNLLILFLPIASRSSAS